MKLKTFFLRYRFACFIFVGIIIGTCSTNAAIHFGMAPLEVYNGAYLSEYADVTMSYIALWKYILKSRLRDFLIIGVVGLTAFRKHMVTLYLIYVGICMGIFISTAVMYYGFTGLGVYLASVLPQYIFYGAAIYFLYKMFFLYGLNKKHIAAIIGIVVVLLLIGTYSEAYVNPHILKNLYQYIYG